MRKDEQHELWLTDEDKQNAEEVAGLLEKNGLVVRHKSGKLNHSRIYRYLILIGLGALPPIPTPS